MLTSSGVLIVSSRIKIKVITPMARIRPKRAPMAMFLGILGDEGLVGRFPSSTVLTASASMISVIWILTESLTASAISLACLGSSL